MTYPCSESTCFRSFGSQRARQQHQNALGHWQCCSCSDSFWHESHRDSHELEFGHKTYCEPCDRHFADSNAYRMHMNSRTHRGATLLCPYCGNAFVNATGLAHHLESGSCREASTLNKQAIFKVVCSTDPWNTFTEELPEASEDCWAGDMYQCPVCDQGFGRLSALGRHLRRLHRQKLYHCPEARCARKFSSLAALFNHLESESCGAMSYEDLQQRAEEVITGSGSLIE